MLLLLPLLFNRGSAGDNDGYNDCNYVLKNDDFSDGTFRIQKSGRYCLGEDISFNPRPGSADRPNDYGAWWPVNEKLYPGSVKHDNGGWALGFFAALSIETSHVELDLMGYEISMAKEFYLQQRFCNLIEVQNAPFNFGQGPANFGQSVQRIKNVHIKNGRLGRSSHNGIHGFDVDNVCVSNLKIYNFEVAGLQFNGFNDVDIRNVDIGPSATDVPFWGYYSHGRFSLSGFDLIDKLEKKYVRFQGDRELSLQQIRDNLRDCLDIAYRFEMGKNTDYDDTKHPLYHICVEMFRNPFRLPDGSALYGMIFNSFGLAVQGFGDSENEDKSDGSKLYLENINIKGLYLNVNEIPTLYFDRCEGYYFNEDGTPSITPVLGRFGDTFDCRRAMKYEDWTRLDRGFGDRNSGYSLGDVKYHGNPLADAQVALGIFSAPFFSNWGLRADADNTRGKETFYRWATDYGSKHDSLPSCARFACNTDAMFHLNKGIIGIRLDGIENAVLNNVNIKNLHNESPLGSYACGAYDGPFDGGQPSGLLREGYMGTDIRGISIINGGTTEVYGSCVIDGCVSSYGDVIGIHLMDDAQVYLDNGGRDMSVANLECGGSVSSTLYDRLMNDAWSPYPNNFYECNIKAERLDDRRFDAFPYDNGGRGGQGYFDSDLVGYVYPKRAVQAECRELFFDRNGERRRRLVEA